MQFAIGFLIALAISLAAYAANRLTRDGAIAAVILGTLVFGLGGWPAAAMLIVFFLSSSLLESLVRPSGRQPSGAYAKSGRRDSGQVLANGIVAVAFLLLMNLWPQLVWLWVGFAGSLAAVTADTWATEVGALSKSAPRLITRLHRVVAPGTAGGITPLGTLAAVLGAGLMAGMATALAPMRTSEIFAPVALAGILGALFDSVLGATVQAMYFCETEQVETEQHPLHRCGSPTTHVRGLRWLNNDLVNLACALLGGAAACAIALWMVVS